MNTADLATIERVKQQLQEWISTVNTNPLLSPVKFGDVDHVFVELQFYRDFYIFDWGGHVPVVCCLFDIIIPESMQRQGLCSHVLSLLEKFTTDLTIVFIVGPIFNEVLEEILLKRKYYKRNAIHAYFDNPKYRITAPIQ